MDATLTIAVLLLQAGRAAPASAPEATVSPARARARTTDLRLVDVAAERGLAFTHQAGAAPLQTLMETTGAGVCVLDFDGDGDDDVYLVSGGVLDPGDRAPAREPSRLFRNDGGRFTDVTEAAGVGGRGYGQGCSVADLEGDGDVDLVVMNSGADELFLNEGSGRFREVGGAAGLADERWTSSAAFADADGDGDLDLFVGAYAAEPRDARRCSGPIPDGVLCKPLAHAALPDRLYRNDGLGPGGLPRLVDVTAAAGLPAAAGRLLGVLFEDLDGDERPDLFLANDMTRNHLLVNRGALRFDDRTLPAGVGYSDRGLTEAGMGVEAGDLDGDGLPDLVVTNFQLETNTVLRGLGAGRWRDVTASSGVGAASFLPLGFGAQLVDLDLDGDLDLFVANGHVDDRIAEYDSRVTHAQPDQLFENLGPGPRIRFAEVGAEALVAVPRVGRGSAWLDLEGDGDLDLVVNDNGGPPLLYENRSERQGRHWLAVELRSVGPNPHGLGARVEVEAAGLPRQWRRIRTACSTMSASPSRACFGLGTASSARVRVLWPDGTVQVLSGLAADRRHVVRHPASNWKETAR